MEEERRGEGGGGGRIEQPGNRESSGSLVVGRAGVVARLGERDLRSLNSN